MSSCLMLGAKQVILPSFKPETFMAALRKYKPTFLHLVPPLVGFLANSPQVSTEDLRSLRQMNVGAAPSGPELIAQFYKKAPKYVYYKGMNDQTTPDKS